MHFITGKACLIQRAVKAFLKKRRKTMNRTRCVQFYWRRFARMIKYSSSVMASRLIKQIYKDKVNKIWR